jgi:hypothetical protein
MPPSSGMACAVARGKQEAARENLAISERELQRVQQQGFGVATPSDRLVMRTPDFRALPWPLLTGPGVTLVTDPNNKYGGRESIHAQDFTAPYDEAGGGLEGRKITMPAYAAPELGFAASSDLAQVDAVSFQGATPPLPSVYQKLAVEAVTTGMVNVPDARRGMELAAFSPNVMPGQGAVGSRGSPVAFDGEELRAGAGVQTLAETLAREALAPDVGPVYGGPSPASRRCAAAPPSLRRGVRLASLGALYDLCHYKDITDELLRAEGCGGRLEYIFTRQGRGPPLLFLLVLCVLLFFALKAFLR